ncbi:hypothetical protein OG921_24025 [Aldersonia sp. NBC_00410]|uniref:lipase/acyltransferase domain-containing protein n=1 Tax=Aldersonia sp. NBC_00410 TaxID=2975954 RepID=UPI002250979A|nr:hypothetical protein [Aldersonia sp. NBC_00410]MCX5046244.1 hypothetical protein [Aldersonia sp. NBC_00410]
MSDEWEFPDADPMPRDDVPIERLTFPQSLHMSTRLIEDAVVVIPGIMGTELIDTSTGKLLWGLKPRLLAQMWISRTSLTRLAVTRDHAVQPGRLLRVPAFAPVLAGIEPYTNLVAELRNIVRHESAILEFGYDWRLSVRHNAGLLAEAIDRHVDAWRVRSDRRDAKVHLVAHSMGGLLCHSLAAIPGATDKVASTITLGTPFEGAAKAMVMLNSGEGTPLRSGQLQAIAVTMPGIYDLLPTYRCIDEGDTIRALTATDVAAAGADRDLADAALAHRAELADVPIPQHRALIGIDQPTMCSLALDAGRIETLFHTFEVDQAGEPVRHVNGILKRFPGLGDGTVPRNSAVPLHQRCTTPLPQQHGPIARTDEAIAFVRDRLLNLDTGPRLGAGDLGIYLPDIVGVGAEFNIAVNGADNPDDIRATIEDVATGEQIDRPHAQRRDGELVVPATIYTPGLHRIRIDGSAVSAVTQLVLADPGNHR